MKYQLVDGLDGVQIVGETGEIQLSVPNDSGNKDWLDYQLWLADGNTPAPPDSVAVLVPQVVTAAQGGIALIQAGLMDAVQAVADASDTPAEVKWAWQRAQTWQRDSPALAYLAQRAGITEKQMDDLFIAGLSIQA